jgi:antitoxin component YwqK of YwqJK toxin-antitoxin module
MQFLLIPLFIFLALSANSQCATYKLASGGDTLNCVDMKGMKQGKWLVQMPKLRGEPGYEEEGVYKNSLKEGMWRSFNLMGDLLAKENFKMGNKNGRCLYFKVDGLEHEESWRAVNPDKSYDTLDVQDLKDPNKYETVIVKTDGSSLKHGIWKYYNPRTGTLVETQEYFMDQLKQPEDKSSLVPDVIKTGGMQKRDSISTVKPKTKEILEFEKKNAKKKNVIIRTGKTVQDH